MGENSTASREPMLEMFIFETVQLVEQLEDILIDSEKSGQMTASAIHEVFRIMHTIKGAAAMMMYDNIARLTHTAEDLFASIRASAEPRLDCVRLTDIVLRVADFIKSEVAKIEEGRDPDGDPEALLSQVRAFLADFSQQSTKTKALPVASAKGPASAPLGSTPAQTLPGDGCDRQSGRLKNYSARVFFEEGCLMENLRAFTIVHNLQQHVTDMWYEPADIADNEASSDIIRETGFFIYFSSDEGQEVLHACLDQTLFLERLEFDEVDSLPRPAMAAATTNIPSDAVPDAPQAVTTAATAETSPATGPRQQNIISVNVSKLDQLMDLVGELVIAGSMVTKNPELSGLTLSGFTKAARQLAKLTNELQDIAMSIRMIPVAATFHKMQRIVRDMNRKLGKDVELVVAGEDTEVDKSIIDSLSDPMMHLIRNALDHGIESPDERLAAGKPEKGTILLEARNAGSDVWITIKDDGRGLDKDKILKKAAQQGLLTRPAAELTDREIFSFILLPGFSTADKVSEFSGRGVGMDVVRANITRIGGTISLDSASGKGTTIQIRIPLTLAIINGMLVTVGDSSLIIPTTNIRETFRAEPGQIIRDTDGTEMLMIRGQCHSLCRLHCQLHIQPRVTDLTCGIIVVVEDDDRTLCLFADELFGEQQVVVKPMPAYLKKNKRLAGCTILGDGRISLILDVTGFFAA